MRIYLDSHYSYCLAAIDASNKYYESMMKAAWVELSKNRLSFDTKTGNLYENGQWVSRYSNPSEYVQTEDFITIWNDYLAPYVKARAARLFNREHV